MLSVGYTRSFTTGRALTDHLYNKITTSLRGDPRVSYDMVEELKEKHAYVSLDYKSELANFKDCRVKPKSFLVGKELEIELTHEFAELGEALFNPHLLHEDSVGLHEDLCRTAFKCDPSIREDLFAHVVLAGATTRLPGLRERLTAELNTTFLNYHNAERLKKRFKLMPSGDERWATWRGGSVVAMQQQFDTICVSKEGMLFL